MLICDTHADTLYAMQEREASQLDVTLERLIDPQHIRVQALALFVGAKGLKGEDADLVERELTAFQQLKAQGFHQIRHIADALPEKANVLLTIEGGEAFGNSVNSVKTFADIGVRIAALVWNNVNLLAHPAVSGSNEGLTPFGHSIAAELRQHRIALDISHLNERGAWELMDSDISPMASHSCAKELCAHPRNLSGDQLKALFAANGFVGVNFYPYFLTGTEHAAIDDVINHMAYMCALGGQHAVGLGSDFDGIERYPDGLRHPGQINALFERMAQRGFDEPLIRGIAGENFARYLDAVDRS